MNKHVKQPVSQQIVSRDDRITKLKKELVYYREISETIREPFIILTNDLYVVTANLAFYQKFQVLKKDTEGRRMYELGDSQWDAPELRELLERLLPKHQVLSDYEITLNFPILGQKTMLLNARQVDSKQLILLAVEDITAQRLLELDSHTLTANLVKQRDRLQALNNAKDEFISLASHQLRTPATAVKQYIAMLHSGFAGKLTKAQVDMLHIAYSSNERQLEIIEDLLRVAKVDAGKLYLEKSSYNVVDQVEAAIRLQTIVFQPRGQTIVFEKPTQKMMVFCDQKLMLMVLENVLDNAGKYSRPDSVVTITLKQDAYATSILIHDNGVGINKQDQQKLFKKFSRIENPLSISVKGTGLGLYWAKKVLDLHDGTIAVTSTPQDGTTFTINTPIVNASPQTASTLIL